MFVFAGCDMALVICRADNTLVKSPLESYHLVRLAEARHSCTDSTGVIHYRDNAMRS